MILFGGYSTASEENGSRFPSRRSDNSALTLAKSSFPNPISSISMLLSAFVVSPSIPLNLSFYSFNSLPYILRRLGWEKKIWFQFISCLNCDLYVVCD